MASPLMSEMSDIAPYSSREELANVITHGVGLLIAVAALGYMLTVMPAHLSVWQKLGVLVYGVSLILMFLTSTLYHSATKVDTKQRLKRLDHCAIYVLIAGSFTPLMSISITSSSATAILIAVWAMAAIGLVFKMFFTGRYEWVSTASYLLMGWLAVVVIGQLYDALPTEGFALLVGGGLAYSLGVVFYASKKIPFNHAIWHCFVLVGALSHCWLIAVHVLRNANVA